MLGGPDGYTYSSCWRSARPSTDHWAGPGGMGPPGGRGDSAASVHDYNFSTNDIKIGSYFNPTLSHATSKALIKSNNTLMRNAGGIQSLKRAVLICVIITLEFWRVGMPSWLLPKLFHNFLIPLKGILGWLLHKPQQAICLSERHKSEYPCFLYHWEKLWSKSHDQCYISFHDGGLVRKKLRQGNGFPLACLQYRAWRNIFISNFPHLEHPIYIANPNQKRCNFHILQSQDSIVRNDKRCSKDVFRIKWGFQ